MLKESTIQQHYELIEEFFPAVLQTIRKDLRQDHLKKDKEFLKAHFGGKNPNKLTIEELAQGYAPVLQGGKELLWEFITERWLMKHTEIYYFFEEKLQKIQEDFTELDVMDLSFAKQLVEEAVTLFGAKNTLIFSVMNSVVFPKQVYEDLRQKARQVEAVPETKEIDPSEDHEARLQREINRIQNKYEKKMLGLQKKYDRDVAALKKQVATLQKKLAAYHD